MKHPVFKSIKAHINQELTFRDDFESLGYIIKYFKYGGKLPWLNY